MAANCADQFQCFQRHATFSNGELRLNGAGQLQQALASRGTRLNYDTVERLLQQMDINRDGGINHEEFWLLDGFMAGLKQTFQDLDVDNSGALSRDEAQDWVRMHVNDVDDELLDDVFMGGDQNNDGTLSFSELVDLALWALPVNLGWVQPPWPSTPAQHAPSQGATMTKVLKPGVLRRLSSTCIYVRNRSERDIIVCISRAKRMRELMAAGLVLEAGTGTAGLGGDVKFGRRELEYQAVHIGGQHSEDVEIEMLSGAGGALLTILSAGEPGRLYCKDRQVRLGGGLEVGTATFAEDAMVPLLGRLPSL